MGMQITSEAFAAGGVIPRKHAQEGQNLSPALKISGVAAGAVELALIVDDPDAPMAEPYVHWVMYKIPASTALLPQGLPKQAKLPSGLLQGKNTAGKFGYDGPAPPPGHGVHHYHFKLYALDAPVKVNGDADKKSLLAAMGGHILEQTEVIGTYERK